MVIILIFRYFCTLLFDKEKTKTLEQNTTKRTIQKESRRFCIDFSIVVVMVI